MGFIIIEFSKIINAIKFSFHGLWLFVDSHYTIMGGYHCNNRKGVYPITVLSFELHTIVFNQ